MIYIFFGGGGSCLVGTPKMANQNGGSSDVEDKDWIALDISNFNLIRSKKKTLRRLKYYPN